MISYNSTQSPTLSTSIIGIGGAGANVLRCFPASSSEQLKLYGTALDDRLSTINEHVEFVQIGSQRYHGMGTGGDPILGRQAAQESEAALQATIADKDLVVLVAGLGGGTGSGVAPYLADLAKAAGSFLVSVVVMPFSFEGPRRREQAETALAQLSESSDLVFCFENDYMEELFEAHSSARSLFSESDKLLSQAAACVPMLASKPGMIHLGLDELKNALTREKSRCLFGIGKASGDDRAIQAAMAALDSPLMNKKFLSALGDKLLVHITGDESLRLSEIREVVECLREKLGQADLEILFGTSIKTTWNDTLRVTLISSVDAQRLESLQEETPPPVPLVDELEVELVAVPEETLPWLQEAEESPEPAAEAEEEYEDVAIEYDIDLIPEEEPVVEPESELEVEPETEPEPEPEFEPAPEEDFSLNTPAPEPIHAPKQKREKKHIERPMFLFSDVEGSMNTSDEPKVALEEPAELDEAPLMFENIEAEANEEDAPELPAPADPIDEGMATPETGGEDDTEDWDTPPSLRSSDIAPWMRRE